MHRKKPVFAVTAMAICACLAIGVLLVSRSSTSPGASVQRNGSQQQVAEVREPTREQPTEPAPSANKGNSNNAPAGSTNAASVAAGGDYALDGGGMSPEIRRAAKRFRDNPGNRQEPAIKLLPILCAGMATNEVEELLGPPSSRRHDGTMWDYTLFYSSSLEVRFDAKGKLQKVTAVGLDV